MKKLRVAVHKDSRKHLCAKCEYIFPECSPKIISFGEGIGNDNVIKCSSFHPISDTIGIEYREEELNG